METIYEQLGITPRAIIGSIVQFELDFATVGCLTQESINDFCNLHNCEIIGKPSHLIQIDGKWFRNDKPNQKSEHPTQTLHLLQIGNFE